MARAMGFSHVESSPLTRSSYHARQAADSASGTVLAVGAVTDGMLDPVLARARAARAAPGTPCGSAGVDVLLLSLGADLPWLTGYEAMPLERITMLVLPADDDATLVVPQLEAPRVAHDSRLFALRPWRETEDPISVIAGLVGSRTRPRRVRPRPGRCTCWRCSRRCRGRSSALASGVDLAAAVREGRRGDRRPAKPPVLPPTGWRRPCSAGRSASSAARRRRSRRRSAGVSSPRGTTR